MNLRLGATFATFLSVFPMLLHAETFVCSLEQDCELGAKCNDLPEPQNAVLSIGADGSAEWELSGIITGMDQIARSDSATSYAASPSPNNAIMLTIHKDGTTALTVHYVSLTEIFSNTMRGSCLVEPE